MDSSAKRANAAFGVMDAPISNCLTRVPPQCRVRATALMAIDGHRADRQRIHAEMERVRADLHDLVAHASESDLGRRTSETRWTNGQLLWHMAFGYLLVRRLLPLVRLGRDRRRSAQASTPSPSRASR